MHSIFNLFSACTRPNTSNRPNNTQATINQPAGDTVSFSTQPGISDEQAKALAAQLSTAICHASLEEITAAVNALPTNPAHRAKIITQPNKNDQTPLHVAAQSGNPETVQLLLDHGAQPSVNKKENADKTPLHLATQSGNPETVQLLLDHGAQPSVNKKDYWGQTPLHGAAFSGNPETMQLLLDHGAQPSVNKKDYWGQTPLHEAAQSGNPKTVQLLLDHGARKSVNRKALDGWTPLHRAAQSRNPETVQLLLDHGAQKSVNRKALDGKTPLHWAVESENPESIKLLLDAQASTNTLDDHGFTPFHEAVRGKRPEVLKLFLNSDVKASVNEKTQYGWTPLHLAATHQSPENTKLLLDHGALESLNVQNPNGRTPLALLQRIGDEDNILIDPPENHNTAGVFLAHGANREDLSDDYRQAVVEHIDTTRNQHIETLINPQATPEQVKEANQWLQWFPPGGGALNWEPPTEQFNRFISDKQTELQSCTTTEEKHQVLDRLQPLLRVNVPVSIKKKLLDAATELKRKDWLADAVQVAGDFEVTQAYLHLASPLFYEREQAVKARNNKSTTTNLDEVD